jgi:hypothetical protein
MQPHTNNISHLLLHDRLMPSDLVNCFTATLTKNEKMRNDLCVIKMCLAKLYSKKEQEQKKILCFSAASETLREDLRTFSFCGRHKFAAKTLLCVTQYFDVVEYDVQCVLPFLHCHKD